MSEASLPEFTEIEKTSEVVLGSGPLSRPAYQRFELGPLISLITIELVEHASSNVGELVKDWPEAQINNASAVVELGHMMVHLAESSTSAWFGERGRSGHEALELGLKEMLDKDYFDFTHYNSIEPTLMEGFRSGLVVPVKLYGLMVRSCVLGIDLEGVFSPQHFTETLRTAWFNEMLHEMAVLPNGALGNWSTSATVPAESGSVAHHMEVVDKGDDYAFSEGSKRLLKWTLAFSNREARIDDKGTHGKKRESGGCPVRHATYKKLGEHATEILSREGIDSTELAAEGRVSSISLCREFVADVVERLAIVVEDRK